MNNLELNKIYCESNLETMERMPNDFVDLVVTSPPYDDLRTYNDNIDKTWNEDIWKEIIKELHRVTKNGGLVVWIVGDSTKNFCESLTSFKNAIFFVNIGFNLLDTMIYYKENYAPAYPTLKRYANQFEYMFVFSKGKPKTFNPIQTVKIRNKEEKVSFRQKDGSFIRKIKKIGKETKDASNVWKYNVAGNKINHPAVFPEQLANDHILSWSNENDLVYDPFMGSGTTAKMAILNNRNFIGSEISQEYVDLANKRLEPYLTQLTLF